VGGDNLQTAVLLPTPTAQDVRDGRHLRQITRDAAERGSRRGIGLNHLMEGSVDGDEPLLLATTTAGLGGGSGKRNVFWAARGEGCEDGPDEFTRAHNPTELVADMESGRIDGFGQYTAAVERWAAVLGREAPAPTVAGKDGRPRLSARFVEWMMGLPDGWVTGVGIAHGPQLKALGNGVVPQQAAHAIRLCMARLEQDNE
jgi:DNA (cytosine-5)-methyltransferase 1